MLFTAIIHPCNTRRQRDFANAMDRAFSSVHFDNTERLTKSIAKMAELSGLRSLNMDTNKDLVSVALEGRVIATWMPRKSVVND